MRRDQAAQNEAGTEALRSAQHGIWIVSEVGVDLGLGNLPADLFRRIGPQPERTQAGIDRLEVGTVVLLLRRDIAIGLPLADHHHDLFAFELGTARRRKLLRDAVLTRLLCLLLLAVGFIGLRKLESLRAQGSGREQGEQSEHRESATWSHRCEDGAGGGGRRQARQNSPKGSGNPYGIFDRQEPRRELAP